MTDWDSEYHAAVLKQAEAYEREVANIGFRIVKVWTKKDGRQIPVRDMDDKHLLNSYKLSHDAVLFREMVLRLFESRLAKQEVME